MPSKTKRDIISSTYCILPPFSLSKTLTVTHSATTPVVDFAKGIQAELFDRLPILVSPFFVSRNLQRPDPQTKKQKERKKKPYKRKKEREREREREREIILAHSH